MKISLKPLSEQVMVVTGASSGIGLATVIAAAQQGAKVVLAARSQSVLQRIATQIRQEGGEAVAICTDVAKREDIENLAATTITQYGRIDTWVNNAGMTLFGRLEDVPDEDSQRLFEVNFWSVVYGSLVSLPYLKSQGGALINLGSEVSEAVFPLQGMYCATKHAIKGFTDALRLELEAEKAPVSVTLIQPTTVDTPLPENAANYMQQAARLPSPLIAPEKVAHAILSAATQPTRDIKVGAKAVLDTFMAKFMPKMADSMAVKQAGHQQRNELPLSRTGILYRPSEEGQIYGRGNENAADPESARQVNLPVE